MPSRPSGADKQEEPVNRTRACESHGPGRVGRPHKRAIMIAARRHQALARSAPASWKWVNAASTPPLRVGSMYGIRPPAARVTVPGGARNRVMVVPDHDDAFRP